MGIIKSLVALSALKTVERTVKSTVKETAGAIADYKKSVRYVYTSSSADDYCGEHFLTVSKELKGCGFSYISLINKKDLKNNWFNKGENGKVTEIMIDGKANFKERAKFRSDAQVTITYHSFRDPK